MAPSELLDEDVPVDKDLSYMTRVVATDFVIFNALIFTVILVIQLSNPVLKILGFPLLLIVLFSRSLILLFLVNI